MRSPGASGRATGEARGGSGRKSPGPWVPVGLSGSLATQAIPGPSRGSKARPANSGDVEIGPRSPWDVEGPRPCLWSRIGSHPASCGFPSWMPRVLPHARPPGFQTQGRPRVEVVKESGRMSRLPTRIRATEGRRFPKDRPNRHGFVKPNPRRGSETSARAAGDTSRRVSWSDRPRSNLDRPNLI